MRTAIWVLAACTTAAVGALGTACVGWLSRNGAEEARRRNARVDVERPAAAADPWGRVDRPPAPEAASRPDAWSRPEERPRRERPAPQEDRGGADDPAPADPQRDTGELRPAAARRRRFLDEDPPPPRRRLDDALPDLGSRDADRVDEDRRARERLRRETLSDRSAEPRDADPDDDLRARGPTRRAAVLPGAADDPAPDREDPPPRAHPGPPAADPAGAGDAFKLTYYDFPAERAGERDVTLYDADCAPIAAVTRDFHDRVCVQGSGRLASGATVSFARRGCACAETCPRTGQHICFDRLDPARFPHGRGAMGRAITPLFTVAVDPSVIPLGTRLFISELAGLPRPDGSVHDGCFLAEDRGLRVLGRKIDVFTGDHETTLAWSGSIRPGRMVHVLLRDARCDAGRARP